MCRDETLTATREDRMENFEINGTKYRTDAETLNVLRGIMQAARDSGDASAVQAVMALGLTTGRIVVATPAAGS